MSVEKERYLAQKRKKRILLMALIAVVAIAVAFFVWNHFQDSGVPTIAVGSKNFTEQLILGNLLADMIEAHTDYQVERKLALGGTQPCVEAIQLGGPRGIDLYVDYASTIYINALDLPVGTYSLDEVIHVLQTDLPAQMNFKPIGSLGFDSPYELSTSPEFAATHNLRTVEDLLAIQDIVRLAPSFEFANREDGLLGLERIYGFEFGEILPMEGGPRYMALLSGEVDVIVTFGTDAMKLVTDLVTLEEERNVFMPMDALIFFNVDSYADHPDVVAAVSRLLGQISNADMIAMNFRVDNDGELPDVVAREFLQARGLI